MSPAPAEPHRPEFDSLDLTVDPDEAREAVESAIGGLVASETGSSTKYRTRDGRLVAVVATDDGETTVAYRTAPAADPATLKAGRLADALSDHDGG